MSAFNVQEYTIPGQHIREYPNGTRDNQEDVIEIAVKKYTPKDNKELQNGAVTIIAANATGFPKEILEPLFDELLQASKSYGFQIRAIWNADWSSQGASGVLNEFRQGDDTSWFDHSRDLLLMINHFRTEMKRPLVGLAHSLGASQLLQLTHYHPRLLHTLILIEPVIQTVQFDYGPNPSAPSAFRPDLWPSRTIAEANIARSRFFKDFDPRALSLYRRYGIRDCPTALYPPDSPNKDSQSAATLTTTKWQEAWSYVKPNFYPIDDDWDTQRLLAPDMDPYGMGRYLFWRAEIEQMWNNLPFVRPSVLWVYGERSHINRAEFREEKMERTGTGLGGSGGAKRGRVKTVVLDGGHMVCCEKVSKTAEEAAKWFGVEIERWKREEEFYKMMKGRGKSEEGGLKGTKEYLEKVRLPPDTLREVKRVGKEKL